MVKIIVTDMSEAVMIARRLSQACNSVVIDTTNHDIEKTSIVDVLCHLQDSIVIGGEEENK